MPRQSFFCIPLLLPVPVSTSHTHSFLKTAPVSFLFVHVGLSLCLFLFPSRGMGLVSEGCCLQYLPDFICPSMLPSMGLALPVVPRVCALLLSFLSLLWTSKSIVSWLTQALLITSTTQSSLFVNERSNCVPALVDPLSTCILDNLSISRNLI